MARGSPNPLALWLFQRPGAGWNCYISASPAPRPASPRRCKTSPFITYCLPPLSFSNHVCHDGLLRPLPSASTPASRAFRHSQSPLSAPHQQQRRHSKAYSTAPGSFRINRASRATASLGRRPSTPAFQSFRQFASLICALVDSTAIAATARIPRRVLRRSSSAMDRPNTAQVGPGRASNHDNRLQ